MNDFLIDHNKGEVRLAFNSEFYGRGAIEQAGKDFAEVCESAIGDENEGRIKVVLKQKEMPDAPDMPDIDVLGYEFCNYVLGLIQNALY